MKIFLVMFGYLNWHYGKAFVSLTNVWKNFLFFVFEFFSINLLFRNFFDPWKRITDNYPKGFDLKIYASILTTNLIMRIVGMIMRAGLLTVGLTCYLLLALCYPLIMVIWLFLPFITLALLVEGFSLIIN